MAVCVPATMKWKEFLFDFNDYDTLVKFENKWTTAIEVNAMGRHKIFSACRVLDQYQGRFGGKGLTHNMVDIKIAIPCLNLWMFDHFCFWYFNRQCGDPEDLLRYLMKSAVAQIFNRFFCDYDAKTVRRRQPALCFRCSHDHREGPSANCITTIPQWYFDNAYPKETGAIQVSRNLLFSSSQLGQGSQAFYCIFAT